MTITSTIWPNRKRTEEEFFVEKILDIITEKMQQAFEKAGYDRSFGRVTVSN